MTDNVLTIIIPTLNAAERLPACLTALECGADLIANVVIVDGGSSDDTIAYAKQYDAQIIKSQRGRGHQLNLGGAQARSDWLLFLHADTVLSSNWPQQVKDHVQNRPKQPASFRLRFDADNRSARWVEALVAWRCRWLGLPYGDQGLLISRKLYEAAGGYPKRKIMEDVALIHALRPVKPTLLDANALTCARRYGKRSFAWRSLRNLALLSCYFLGASDDWLARMYER